MRPWICWTNVIFSINLRQYCRSVHLFIHMTYVYIILFSYTCVFQYVQSTLQINAFGNWCIKYIFDISDTQFTSVTILSMDHKYPKNENVDKSCADLALPQGGGTDLILQHHLPCQAFSVLAVLQCFTRWQECVSMIPMMNFQDPLHCEPTTWTNRTVTAYAFQSGLQWWQCCESICDYELHYKGANPKFVCVLATSRFSKRSKNIQLHVWSHSF